MSGLLRQINETRKEVPMAFRWGLLSAVTVVGAVVSLAASEWDSALFRLVEAAMCLLLAQCGVLDHERVKTIGLLEELADQRGAEIERLKQRED